MTLMEGSGSVVDLVGQWPPRAVPRAPRGGGQRATAGAPAPCRRARPLLRGARGTAAPVHQ
ncbi:hypothetical protein WT49_13705 [Burkholderia territorii]|nr:hypothetical protein WT49_13705 [Burkholderia territorii]KWE46011.1 hypothetical protein WT51_17615 [Burkholderia territorii]KWE48345.1 hypothetical protein WT50_05155 [Burkholderia territorii]